MEDLVNLASLPEDPWRGRRVFLTGHTGFKGGWLTLWMASRGAIVRGYALDPPAGPSLFSVARVGDLIDDVRGDIRDAGKLEPALREFAPEIVFHMAAQPLVRASYVDPIGTLETNVIGTARMLDAVRRTPSVRAVVSVTTDKCYENREWHWGYRESDPLGGYDPYSSSKACAELVSAAYRQSFFPIAKFDQHRCAIATARAGNVIGGGDWSADRLIPDLIRGFIAGQTVSIRSSQAIRPWQHVLEPLHGYMLLAQKLIVGEAAFATAFNFGPFDDDVQPVGWIAERLAQLWGRNAEWQSEPNQDVHEATYLKLDASRARAELGWRPRLQLPEALEWLTSWYKAWYSGENMQQFTMRQIASYETRTAFF